MLAPSFSPKVRSVLDCLFIALRALVGRTFSSFTSICRSFSYSVVLALPEEAWEATLASQAAGAAQGTHCQPRRGVQQRGLSPGLFWTCRKSLSFSVPAPSCPMQCPAWAAVPDHRGQERQRCGAQAAPLRAGAQTPTALLWPLSHRELAATDMSGNHMG